MRIALLFAGRIRAWEHCYSSFKQYILDPNADNTIDAFLCHNAENKQSNIDEFIKQYDIKKYENIEIDISKFIDVLPLDKEHNGMYMSLKMYYCWKRAVELMKSTSKDYDIIIYLRVDSIFNTPLILPTDLPENTLYVPFAEDWGGLNDQFALGGMKVMEHYTNIYNNVLSIYEATKVLFHTETYVKLHNSSMIINRFRLNWSLHPSRRN